MDNRRGVDEGIDATGLSVRLDETLQIASLRYFDLAGTFVAALDSALGGPMPEPLRAVLRTMGGAGIGTAGTEAADELVLAWRSPTETLLLSHDSVRFTSIAQQAADRVDGCMVDQTNGIGAYTVTGVRAPDLLVRLGSTAAIPALGEARTGRLAELTVTSLCVRPGETLLLVERVYSRHLMGWIAATAGDF
jgi:hypothetical protein